MIVFIIPLKSAQLSKSWSRVSKLFERTLRSICNQTSPDFRVIIVCHEKPTVNFNHPHVTYIEVDFPVPAWQQTGNPQKDYADIRRDKSRKIWTGLIHVRSLNPSHVMFVDADDCISKRIAEFVSQNPHHNGWFISRGYEYQDGSKIIYHKKNNFYKKCGTSHIIRYDLLLHDSIKFDNITYDYLRHRNIKEMLDEQGKSLDLLPFDGAVYITENQENIWFQKKVFFTEEKYKRHFSFLSKECIQIPCFSDLDRLYS